MSRVRLVGLLFVSATVSCARPRMPAAPAPREATEVSAPQGRTWDAVIDVFAERNIPIRTIDRASGLIATDRMGVTRDPRRAREPDPHADCGSPGFGVYEQPDGATYNVLVRGDSARSTVRVTVLWSHVVAAGLYVRPTQMECTSRGVWEAEAEAEIKARAERVAGR